MNIKLLEPRRKRNAMVKYHLLDRVVSHTVFEAGYQKVELIPIFSRNHLGTQVVIEERVINFHYLGTKIIPLFQVHQLKEITQYLTVPQIESRNKRMRLWLEDFEPIFRLRPIYTLSSELVFKGAYSFTQFYINQKVSFINESIFKKKVFEIYGKDFSPAIYMTIMVGSSKPNYLIKNRYQGYKNIIMKRINIRSHVLKDVSPLSLNDYGHFLSSSYISECSYESSLNQQNSSLKKIAITKKRKKKKAVA